MKTIELKATRREKVGKIATRALRKAGMVPCALYANGEAISLSLPEKEVNKVLYTPDTYLIKLDVNGIVYNAIVQEAQFHPVHEYTMHVDFLKVTEEKPIIVKLPVKLVGSSAGVAIGGKLVQKLRKMTVKGIYTQLPDQVEVDVTPLKLGKSLITGNVPLTGFSLAMRKDVAVASVEIPRALRQGYDRGGN